MPPRGRPRKPTEDHKRVGTYRPDRHGRADLALAEVPPAEPVAADLPPAETVDGVFAAARVWLAKTDNLALAILRESLEERQDIRERALGGSSEARRELREIDKQIISQLSQLGFDPSARARLGLTEVRAKSKLEELRSRQSGSGANGQPQGDPRD